MKEVLQSPVTWSGLLTAIGLWFGLLCLCDAVKFLIGLAYRASRRRLVRRAIERVRAGDPEAEAELKRFIKHLDSIYMKGDEDER